MRNKSDSVPSSSKSGIYLYNAYGAYSFLGKDLKECAIDHSENMVITIGKSNGEKEMLTQKRRILKSISQS